MKIHKFLPPTYFMSGLRPIETIVSAWLKFCLQFIKRKEIIEVGSKEGQIGRIEL